MTRPVLKKTEKALALLEQIHPKYPTRHYTVFEAATKYKVGLATIYRHLKKKELAAQQQEVAE